jgi:hypothetical protein
MTVPDLIGRLKSRGVEFTRDKDGRVRLKPRRLVSQLEVEILRAHRDEIEAILQPTRAMTPQDDDRQDRDAARDSVKPSAQVGPVDAGAPGVRNPNETSTTSVEAPTLPREKWDGVGIVELRGIPTHARGDEHAQRILTGQIPYERAVADEKATRDMNLMIERYAFERRSF